MNGFKKDDKIKVIDQTLEIEIICKVDKIKPDGTIKLKGIKQ